MGIRKIVKEFPAFKRAWHNFGDDDRFKSWEEVEGHYHFKMIPNTNLNNSTIQFESEKHYIMFVLEWR